MLRGSVCCEYCCEGVCVLRGCVCVLQAVHHAAQVVLSGVQLPLAAHLRLNFPAQPVPTSTYRNPSALPGPPQASFAYAG